MRMRRHLCIAAALVVFTAGAAGAPYVGPRKTIAVGGFEAAETMGGAATADGLSAMLTAALVKDGRFVVAERNAMAQIQWEQTLGQTGGAAPGTAPPPGQLIGAGVLVRGTVTKFDPKAHGATFGIGGPSLFGSAAGTIGLSGSQAIVEVTLRMIDTTTGQVIDTSSATGTASSGGFDVQSYHASGMQIGGGAFAESPLGKACEDAVNHALEHINLGMEHAPWSALIVDNTGDQIFLNAGANQNMQPGMKLHVIRKVRVLTDPATGVVLETITQPLADIEVKEVHEKVSIATLVSGSPPARGDVARLN